MESVVSNASKLVAGLGRGSKVFSVSVVECKQNVARKKVNAVVIVFKDGHIEVGCPIKRGVCSYCYGYRQPIRIPKERPWYKDLVTWVILVILAVLVFVAIVASIHFYMPSPP